MSRKLSKKALHFARVWGDVKSLDDQEWLDLLELHNGLVRAKAEEPKKREPRKPKPESGTVTVEDTDAVVRKMNLRGPKSGAPEGGAG